MSANEEEGIRKALRSLMEEADAANEAAACLSNEVLIHLKSLISEATIARETATLLQHVSQNLGRTMLAALDKANRREALHDS